jgi:Flp pilus assembly protein TadD
VQPTVLSKLIEAECHFAEGDRQAGMRLLEELTAMEPRNARAFKMRADLLLEDGYRDQAVALLEQAAELDPFEYDVRAQLMTAYSQNGETERAIRLKAEMEQLRDRRLEFTKLHHLARTNPKSASVRLELGLMAKSLGKLELARSWFKAALALEPNDATALSELKQLDEDTEN